MPAAGSLLVVVVVEGGPVWLLPHPVAPPMSATANATSSSPPRRRLRGNVSSSRDAMVTPEPAAYHGVAPGVRCAGVRDLPGAPGDCRRSEERHVGQEC